MRNLKLALRTVFAGLMLSAGAAAAPAVALDADLGVTFATATAVKYGGTKAFVATITNNGPNHATGITVNSTIPTTWAAKGLKVTSVDGCTPTTTAAAAGNFFPCTVPDITDTFTADVTINTELALPDPLPTTCGVTTTYDPLTVTVSSTSVDAVTANNAATITPVDVPLVFADISVDFTGPATAAVGQNVVYNVTVTNHGPCTSQDVWVLSDAYGSSPFVSATWTCLNTPPDGKDVEGDGCQLGDIAAAASVTFTKTYSIPSMASDAVSLYHPNGVTLARKIPNTAVTVPPLPARTMKLASALLTRDLDLGNNSSGMRTEVTQSATGCSSAGAGGPTALLMVGAALLMAFRRRRTA